MIQHSIVNTAYLGHHRGILRVYPEAPVYRVLEPLLYHAVFRKPQLHRARNIRDVRFAGVVQQACNTDAARKSGGMRFGFAGKAVLPHRIEAPEVPVRPAQQGQRMSDVLRADILRVGFQRREENSAPCADKSFVSHVQCSD